MFSMKGQIALMIRYLLYPAAGALVTLGFATFDRAAGTITIDLNALSAILAGFVVYVGTVLWSMIARRGGGKT